MDTPVETPGEGPGLAVEFDCQGCGEGLAVAVGEYGEGGHRHWRATVRHKPGSAQTHTPQPMTTWGDLMERPSNWERFRADNPGQFRESE